MHFQESHIYVLDPRIKMMIHIVVYHVLYLYAVSNNIYDRCWIQTVMNVWIRVYMFSREVNAFVSPCFFKRRSSIHQEIYHHNGVKRVSRVNNKFITCVRAFVKKNVLVCCAYIQFVLLFVKRQKSVKWYIFMR